MCKFKNILWLFPILIFLAGCQQLWYFSIKDITDLSQPIFCISGYVNCKGKGITFSTFDIIEVDKTGKKIKDMWIIDSTKNIPLKEFRYGVTPVGWKEIVPAQQLEAEKFYSIHGSYFLIFHQRDGIIRPEVYTPNDFFIQK